jgi:hypothetical protein
MADVQGKQEIIEAAVTSLLTALLTGLVAWGIETAKKSVEARRQPKDEE